MTNPGAVIAVGDNAATQLNPDHAERLRRLGLEVMGPSPSAQWQNYLYVGLMSISFASNSLLLQDYNG